MKLILLRHGDALSAQIDLARPLSAVGRSEVESVGAQIDALDFGPVAIYHSPKRRAAQSAAIIADTVDGAPEPEERDGMLPNDPIEPFVDELIAAEDDLVLVGHLPWLQDLADELLASAGQRAPAMGTACALVLVRLEGQRWHLEQTLNPER